MESAPLTITKDRTIPKNGRARPRHVTQLMISKLVGVSTATLGRWCCEFDEGDFPDRNEHWKLTDAVNAALFAAIVRCPDVEKNRHHVVDVFKMLRRSLLECFGDGLKIVVFWSKGGGLALADDRSMVPAMLEESDNSTAATWTLDIGVVVESTVAAYRAMLRTEGLTDREAELEAATASAKYWTRTEDVGVLNENGFNKATELLT